MKFGLEIRHAQERDLQEVMMLERETGSAPHWGAPEYAGMLREGQGSGLQRALFVAADGCVVSGFAVGSVLYEEAEIESVVVRDLARRGGLGSLLCRAVMDWSRTLGAKVVGLEVRASSTGAIRLYGGLGFVTVARRASYYRESPDDAVIMRCEMGPRDPTYDLFEKPAVSSV